MSKIYKIETVGDFLKVPSDRIHDCLSELADQLKPVMIGLESLGLNSTGSEVKTFTWEDDGKRDLNITLNCIDGRSATFKFPDKKEEG